MIQRADRRHAPAAQRVARTAGAGQVRCGTAQRSGPAPGATDRYLLFCQSPGNRADTVACAYDNTRSRRGWLVSKCNRKAQLILSWRACPRCDNLEHDLAGLAAEIAPGHTRLKLKPRFATALPRLSLRSPPFSAHSSDALWAVSTATRIMVRSWWAVRRRTSKLYRPLLSARCQCSAAYNSASTSTCMNGSASAATKARGVTGFI